MTSLRSFFLRLPKNTQYMLIVIFVMVGMWMFITPFYDWIKTEFGLTPIISIILGGIIVYIGVRKWRLRLW